MNDNSRKKCQDCIECQFCSENRCRLCRNERHFNGSPELGTGFTHGEYLEWKRKKKKQHSLPTRPPGVEKNAASGNCQNPAR